MGNSFYTRADGMEKMRTRSLMTRSDTADKLERSYSDDNGRTWSEWEEIEFIFPTPEGTRRVMRQPGFVDPESLMLVRDSVSRDDDRGPDDDASLTLSNFMAHEDRISGEAVVHMSRLTIATWTGDARIYRLEI